MSTVKDLEHHELAKSKIYHPDTSLSDRIACDQFMDKQFELKGTPVSVQEPEVRKEFEEVYKTALKQNLTPSSKKYFL